MQRRTYLRAGAALIGSGVLAAASDPVAGQEYGPVSRTDVPGAKEVVVGEDGDWVYLATTDGFATVDASDPSEPTVAARVSDVGPADGNGTLSAIYDVKYEADRLLVAGQGSPAGTLGFALIDVSDPANPRQVLFQELEFSVHNCLLDGGVAYLTTGPNSGDTFTAYDVSDDEATELGSWRAVDANEDWADAYPGGPDAHDIWVQDGIAYPACWDAGVFVVDVSDPANPTYVTEFGGFEPAELAELSTSERQLQGLRPPGNAHYTATDESGNLLGLGGESWALDGEGGPMGIDLYDVSDPADPQLLSTIDPPESPDSDRNGGISTTSHNFEFRDGTLYSSWYRGGVKRHDVSDPAEPVEETWWRRPHEASFWTAQVLQPGETFVATHMGISMRASDASLYVFPDEAGESLAPYETPTPADTPAESTATASPGGTAPPTPTATTSSGGSASQDETSGQTATPTEADSPGFGPLATLSALGLGGLRLLRKRRAE
jgi:hypothetical protein